VDFLRLRFEINTHHAGNNREDLPIKQNYTRKTTTMLNATTCSSHTVGNPLTLAQLRQVRDENHTLRVDNLIVDKRTGEVIGCYVHSQFTPEPYSFPARIKKKAAQRPRFVVLDDDGSPLEVVEVAEASPLHSAVIIQFPTQITSEKSNAGRPRTVLSNPVAELLQYYKAHKIPATWMENYIIGACGVQVEHEGGTTATTGRFNVSPSDVLLLLRQFDISTESAATVLCNHYLEPMGVRQVERVVQAARIALGGLMRHLELHPLLLAQVDYTLDFDAYWKERGGHLRGESPDKAAAMKLFRQDHTVSVGAVAKMFGVHRNTAGAWKQQALMHN